MAREVVVSQIAEGVYLATRPLDEELEVRAALLLGRRRAAVIDTLLCPEDMAPFLTLLAAHGRPYVVVNTHADWDHVWGNAAFPNAPIIGHRLCRERMRAPDRAASAQIQSANPDRYANVALLPPTITFESTLTIDLGDLTLALHHLPGHTADCLLAHLPERRLLYAGDCAEVPFPFLESGPLDTWIAGLRAWSTHDLATVVPAHGAIGGVDLLRGNADYLAALPAAPLPPGVSPFYHAGHRANQEAARRLEAVTERSRATR